MVLAKGEKAGSFKFLDQSGKERKFPEEFGGEKTALFFLRHLGCPLCKAKIAELKTAAPRFKDKGVRLIAVVQSTPRRVAEFWAKEGLSFILVPDREKRLYNAFQVRRGGFKEYTAPSAFKATVRATLQGHMHGRFEGDEFQVPAAFLLAPGGEIVYVHYGKDISDFGDVDELLRAAG